MAPAIAIDRSLIADFCRGHHVQTLSLFGSVLRDDFSDQSDVDVLVEFEPDAVVGFIEMGRMELELSSLWGYPVDLRTPAELSKYFRQEVLDSAETLYVSR